MYRVRMLRLGRKKKPFFRIVVSDSKSPRLSSGAKILGFVSPFTKEVVFNKEELLQLVDNGAKISKNLFWRIKKIIPSLSNKSCG